MRIVAGERKGLQIKTIEGDSTRPTRDMVREALFSILMNRMIDAKFLDLFAGSGAIGIEALSRGASKAVFCDSNSKCTAIINDNLEKANYIEKAEVYNTDYKITLKKLKENNQKFDLIYIDPPYHQGLAVNAALIISEYAILEEDGVLIIETDTNEEIPDEIGMFERYNYKRYGRNILNLFRRKG